MISKRLSEKKNEIKKMKSAALVQEIQKIKIAKPDEKEITIDNPTDLLLINRNKKFVLFRIDEHQCALYFAKEDKAEREYNALLAGAKRDLTPHPYGFGSNYVVMEWMDAPSVAEYLSTNRVTRELTQSLLQLLRDFEEVGYTSGDHPLKDILIMSDGRLKVIHVSHKFNAPKLFPRRMIGDMRRDVELFIQYVKDISPSLYDQWASHPEFLGFIEDVINDNCKK